MSHVYSAVVEDHFARPRNLGRLPDANGHGTAGDLLTGDTRVEIAIRVADGRIAAARFRAFGCSALIAASSMTTLLLEGASLAEAAHLTAETIATALDGLPDAMLYAPALVAKAAQSAVADYQRGSNA